MEHAAAGDRTATVDTQVDSTQTGHGEPDGNGGPDRGQSDNFRVTARTRLRRLPERGSYDRETVHAILDEGFVCHVGFEVDGRPYVIPTGYARVGGTLYLHGSSGSHLGLQPGTDVCVTVTLLDGLVLARSAFHHSMAYRSVIAFGRAREVTDPQEKDAALRAVVEHIAPGRSAEIRGGNRKELAATAVLALELDEVSAKGRWSGEPNDEDEDYDLPVWAGTLPLAQTAGRPIPDPRLAPGIPTPAHMTGWRRPAPAKEQLPAAVPDGAAAPGAPGAATPGS